ncbi:MAG: hypothetical protein K2Q22_06220 [Cytophagales bacterium]|nr:hypothetical protein [Cytophagales bacterium]
MDFTKAKMIGQFTTFNEVGKKTGLNIRDEYFEGWNEIVKKESSKFDLNKYLHVNFVRYETDSVKKFNSEVDENTIMSDGPLETALTKSEIQIIASKYANSRSGIGLVFIVEKFDALENRGVVDIVYFKEGTGEVLLARKLSANPGASTGLKNRWIGSILNILKYIGNEKWSEWKNQALKENKKNN